MQSDTSNGYLPTNPVPIRYFEPTLIDEFGDHPDPQVCSADVSSRIHNQSIHALRPWNAISSSSTSPPQPNPFIIEPDHHIPRVRHAGRNRTVDTSPRHPVRNPSGGTTTTTQLSRHAPTARRPGRPNSLHGGTGGTSGGAMTRRGTRRNAG